MRQGFVFVIIVSAVFCAPVLAYDWSTNPGEGSPENPYQISTPEQLIAIGSDPNVYNLFKHFALTSDIIFDPNNNPEHVFNGAVIPRLRGSIDGCGFAIENLRISADTSNGDRVGLIGTFGDHGNRRLENLNIPNAQITIEGNAQEVGILCGLNGGYIHNCDVSGTITCGSGYQIGGICGVNGREAMGLYGAITHCQTDVSISSSSTRGRFEECGGISGYGNGNIIHCSSVGNISAWSLNVVGGISGFQWYGSIISSSTSVNISAQRSLYYSGGLCGRNRFGIISHSYATGNMTLEGTSFISSSELYWVGAFCGHNIEGTIENCYSTGDIYCSSVEFGGGEESGGFCGRNSFGSEIRNCFSTGDIVCGPITGDIPAMHKSRWVGGFCGTNDASIINCYSTGIVDTDATDKAGFCYMDYDTIENSFWDTETSGILTGVVGDPITGVTGKTTAEMQDPNTFLDAGWDFVDETANGEEDIWEIDVHQYPRLYRPAYSGGDGSPENPFKLSLAQDLIDLGKSKGDYFDYFMLLNDIDLSEYTFDNSVISKHERNNFPNRYYGHLFCGVLDGNGFSVRNLTIASVDQSFVGLFGAIDPFGIVKNLYLEDVDISVTLKNSSGATHTGGICGENSGKILQCAVTGTINGSFVVGGICGSNKSIIQDSYSSCNIVGFTNIGGVCGDFGTRGFGGPVMNRCYSSSLIQSERESKGGLSGYIGMQAQMTNCFWDTTISGLPSGYIVGPWVFEGIVENVEGYTTFQMKQQANFIGWDFENVWWIDEGNGYPILRWQMPNAAPVADAGMDVTVNASLDGYALVQLDGTESYDEDDDPLEYFWYDGNDLIATGAEPNVVFGLGHYEVTLIVNDGIVDSEPNSCVVTVVDPFEVLAGDINELVQHNGVANSLLAKLDAARKKLEDGNENNDGAAVGSLGAFINAVNAQRGKKISEDDADHLIVTAQQIIEMLSGE